MTASGTASTWQSKLLARPAEGAPADPRTGRARLVLCAVALGLAPILLTLGTLLSVDVSEDAAQAVTDIAADRGRFIASNVLFALGAGALVPGAIALARLARARGAAWTTTGACMVAIGGGALAMAIWSYNVVGALGTADSVPAGSAVPIFDEGDDSVLFGLPWVVGIGGLLGMIVVGIGLIRARTVPLWLAVLLIVAPVVTFLGGEGVLGAVLSIPLLVAMVALAYEALRTLRAPQARPVVDLTDRAAESGVETGAAEMPTPRQTSERPQPDRTAGLG